MQKAMAVFGQEEIQTTGFSTASGKNVKQPSTEAIQKAMAVFGQEEIQTTGFSTASGKNVKQPSTEAIQKAMAAFGQEEIQKTGFSTASGKNVKQPSTEAMQKAMYSFLQKNEHSKETPEKENKNPGQTLRTNVEIPILSTISTPTRPKPIQIDNTAPMKTPITQRNKPVVSSARRRFRTPFKGNANKTLITTPKTPSPRKQEYKPVFNLKRTHYYD
jgi:phosphoribosylformylglycinamidine (FGAM) synthase PurS component